PGSASRPMFLCLAARAQLPAAAAVDLHRHDVVATRFERGDHACGRRERDRVLARAAAEDHGDAAAHGVVVVEVVVVVPSPPGDPVSWPTWIVTTSPVFASAPGAGSC